MREIELKSKSGDFVVLREPTFEKFIELNKIAENGEITDEIIEKYFVVEQSKPLKEFSDGERDQIFSKVMDILNGEGITDEELLYLTMAIFYRTTPEHIRNLSGLYGLFLLNGMNLTTKYEKPKAISAKSISEGFKVDSEQINEFLKRFGVK